MDCHDFEIRLEALLDGALPLADRDSCLVHAESCPKCGELLAAVQTADFEVQGAPGESLVDSVLASTVGSTCDRARQYLPALTDRELAPADEELVRLHLDNCATCARTAATLVQLQRDLPRLAEAPVDEQFTAQVLAATLPTRTRWLRWWSRHWANWIQRPRFAMEAAYAGLLVVMLVLGAFSTPLAALPQKGVELMQPEPNTTSVWTKSQEGLGTFWEWVASMFEKVEKEPESTEETP